MEKVECRVNGIRDWLKFVKKRFWTNSPIGSKRNKIRQNEQRGRKILVDKYHAKKPKSLEYFLKIMSITEKEFMDIALKHQISPWKYDEVYS